MIDLTAWQQFINDNGITQEEFYEEIFLTATALGSIVINEAEEGTTGLTRTYEDSGYRLTITKLGGDDETS